jgi:glutamyl-tRNA reductase
VDDLQSIANDYLQQRREEIARCEEIIAARVKPLLAGTSGQPASSAAHPSYSHA